MIRKLFIYPLGIILPFILVFCILRISYGLSPFISIQLVKNEIELYDPPHYTEYLLKSNFFDSDTGFGAWWNKNNASVLTDGSDSYSGTLLYDVIDSVINDERKGTFSGLEITDTFTLPIALFLDIGYTAGFLIQMFDHLATGVSS